MTPTLDANSRDDVKSAYDDAARMPTGHIRDDIGGIARYLKPLLRFSLPYDDAALMQIARAMTPFRADAAIDILDALVTAVSSPPKCDIRYLSSITFSLPHIMMPGDVISAEASLLRHHEGLPTGISISSRRCTSTAKND